MEARVDEAVYLLAASIDEQERARHDEGARGQKALVKQARCARRTRASKMRRLSHRIRSLPPRALLYFEAN